MSEEEIRSIALFFFFVSSDYAKGLEAASEALADFREITKKPSSTPRPELLILSVMPVWHKFRAHSRRVSDQGSYPEIPQTFVPENVDVSHWREFQKSASAEELSAVVWSGILGMSDATIASALNLSEGTIRYRLGKGYARLGGTFGRPRQPGIRT